MTLESRERERERERERVGRTPGCLDINIRERYLVLRYAIDTSACGSVIQMKNITYVRRGTWQVETMHAVGGGSRSAGKWYFLSHVVK
jgi:hypothetical protein